MTTQDVVTHAAAGLTVTEWVPGGGPVVLALPGLTSSAKVWAPVAAAVSGVRFLAPDLRGRGTGVGAVGSTGLPSHARDVARIMVELDLTDVVLVGHSMGAFLVPLVARAVPERVQRLVLVDGGLSPLPPFFPAALTRAVFRRQFRRQLRERRDVEELAREAKLERIIASRPELHHVVLQMLHGDVERTENGVRPRLDAQWCLADAVDTFHGGDPLDALAGLDRPIHMILARDGRYDGKRPFIADRTVAAAQVRIPDMTVTRVAGNHVTVLFAPELADAITGRARL